jgi:hypothetical protein
MVVHFDSSFYARTEARMPTNSRALGNASVDRSGAAHCYSGCYSSDGLSGSPHGNLCRLSS